MMLGFSITNHPQQVAKRGASDGVDERITPQWLFEELHGRFQFTLDAAANARNAKLPLFFDLEADGLKQSWVGHSVWCNPPYSNLAEWVGKARREVDAGALRVVMLLPANRTEQRWWHELVEPWRDRPGTGMRCEFIRRRLNFGVPGNEAGRFHSSPPFGLVLLIIEPAGAIMGSHP